jgi:hypothetical protein
LIHWRPSLSALTAAFKRPRPWTFSLEGWGKGIDNAHVDVFLSPRLRERLRDGVRALIRDEIRTLGQGWREEAAPVVAARMDAFCATYLTVFEAVLARSQADASSDLLALFQVALLKSVLQSVAHETRSLLDELKGSGRGDQVREPGLRAEPPEDPAVLAREEHAIVRRVLLVLFRELRRLEGERIKKLRASLAGDDWPVPEEAFYNPVLTVPDLERIEVLAPDYPIAQLGESGDGGWLFRTDQCISKVFQHYLPSWTQSPSHGAGTGRVRDGPLSERLDQGQLGGFLETEILLRRFVSRDEYHEGRCSWLDEPRNLHLFLSAGRLRGEPAADESFRPRSWSGPRWRGFQRAMVEELHRCLDFSGLTGSVTLLYWLESIRAPLGRAVPFPLVVDYVEGRLARRRLAQRLEAMRLGLEGTSVLRVLDRASSEIKRLPPGVVARYLDRYLVDFLTLRRDLKLAYKAYQAMDAIRVLDDPREVRLSRSNASLIELDEKRETSDPVHRVRGHAVIKADVRGSTLITQQLCERGLNPASHFSLNFFDPVNKLLPELGAEKVFVEGDAVILAIFEHQEEGVGSAVARACILARSILQVVAVQNALNRKHDLPDLELGLGIAYTPGEPSFLFDEGQRIMISGAINRADRLSACAARLRREGFDPGHPGLRVAVVRDPRSPSDGEGDDDLLELNVNGIRIDDGAFFKLQKELRLRQVRVPEDGLDDTLVFAGQYQAPGGHNQWLAVRYGPVRDWDGQSLGAVDEQRRHFFEVIVDAGLANRIRKLGMNAGA